ncbi:MAG: hypothetical protein QM765_01840 [Myxococcales bacterium]
MSFQTPNWRTGLVLALVIASAAACPSPVPAGPDAAPSLPDVGIEVVDSGPPPPPGLDAGPLPLQFKARAVSDAGAFELGADAANEIPVESRFELELGNLKDVRVRLFDEADKAVPSTDKLELGQATRYFLAPNEPLTPGSGYALVIDGLKNFEATDSSGKSLEVTRIGMRTLGEKPAPAASAKSGKAKKKSDKKTKKK